VSRPGYPGHPANIAKVLVDRVLGQDGQLPWSQAPDPVWAFFNQF